MTEKLKEEKADTKRLIKEMFEMNPRGDFSREAIDRYGVPSEYVNIARWMIVHGYSDGEIQKVVGHNALRMLEEVWV